jgi:hypothetical protein
MAQLDISESTLNQARECPIRFRCLSDAPGTVCPVEKREDGGALFIHTNRQRECPYLEWVDGGYVCRCPVRIELYERYHM